jgi:hypothetical protein
MLRHSREGGNPRAQPNLIANCRSPLWSWIPAFAGMTTTHHLLDERLLPSLIAKRVAAIF